MEQKLIKKFRESLEGRQRELRSSLSQGQQQGFAEEHDYGKDEGDRANMSLAKEIDLSQKSRDRAMLSSIEGALKRINEGTFGECLNCGQDINANRLQAIPWARYCIGCQELIDEAK